MEPADARRLAFGSRLIGYSVRRSPRRRKTIAISVDPADGVLVTAPIAATDAELACVVRAHAAWIVARLADVEGRNRSVTRREWVTGEALPYLGRNYRLRVITNPSESRGYVRLNGGWVEVHLPACGDGAVANRDVVARLVEQWYRRTAAGKLRERVDFHAPRLGVTPNKILVRSQEKRWASCSPDGTLRFNWRIVMAPLALVDYVVIHELCHLRYANHDRAFWQAVGAVIPDYALRREALRRNGSAYTLGF